ncbi:MAG: alpha/beta hydrolase family protein, partial [Blastocatellia bacterium]
MKTDTGEELPVPELAAGVITDLHWHSSQPYLGFVFSSTKHPADVFSVNIATGKLDRWTTAFTSIKTDSFREPDLIRWKSFDERTVSGFLYRPSERFSGKRPVIVYLHGGLHDQFRPGFLAQSNYFINALGIAMVYPNVRGSTGYGKTFMTLDDRFLRADATRDVGCVLDWIRTQPDLDAGRVLVAGDSSGGYLALSVAETYGDKISGVLTYSAPTNLATLIERTIGNNPGPWRRKLGDERDKKTREFFERTAPANNAEKITRPVFLFIGGKDLIVSATETARIVTQVRNKGLPAWYLVAKGEGHSFANGETYSYVFGAEVVFIRQVLGFPA